MMKNELEVTANHAKMSREEDPIALIKNIKGVTHDFRDQWCATGSLWHTHKQLFSCVQREDEDIEDYFDCFKNDVEVTENNDGKLGIKDDPVQQDEMFKNYLKPNKMQKKTSQQHKQEPEKSS